jgi:hypothetical protein
MSEIINKILKFLLGFGLAILLSGFVYNYFPDFLKLAKESGFFMASLVDSQNQKNQDILFNLQTEKLDSTLTTLKSVNLKGLTLNNQEDEISQQEKLDDLAEQIDVIRRQINDLLEAKRQKEAENEDIIEDKNQDKKEEKDLEDESDMDDELADIEIADFDKNKTNYLQILISEVQIAGENDDKQEFVELYNPNEANIDLTNWYLQRKTKNADNFSTYVSSNLFLNKIIYAKSYFLIARQGSFFVGFADVVTDNPLTEDNALALKNPNKENSDLLGFGGANEFLGNVAENPKNGKTIGRKWIENSEQNIGANYLDFEAQLPTPKTQNIKYIEPVVVTGGGGGGGSAEIIYDKILISEVKIAERTGDKNVFIELYNPNNKEVDLTGWYIFRNNSSFITKTMLEGKKISANGYFLISKTESLWQDLSDLQFDGTLNEDDNISLKNPKADLTDSASWSKIIESLTWGRKDNVGDFEIQTPTPKAQNITFVETPIVEIPKDTTPPEVIFGLLPAIQTSLNFSINFQISDLLGTVTPSGISSYIFKWNDVDTLITENWHEDLLVEVGGSPMSATFSKDFIGQDGKTYYFQVKAKDVEGNESEWLPTDSISTKIELPPPPPPPELLPIVINEIQIEGEEKSHDFIEIYNPNDVEILLDEYRIVKRAKTSSSDTTIKSWGAQDKILSKQYYLWANSTDENYPVLVGADISTKQNISDNNGIAIRKGAEDIGEIVDAIGWGEFDNVLFEELAFITNPEKNKSISRVQGADTNDNSKDFIILDTPTPKAE